MSSRSFILLVGDDGALLVPPRGLNFHVKAEPESILETLARFPRAPVIILADTLAQDYKIETLPPLSFFDRRKLIVRRLAQAFPHKRLKNAQKRKNGAFLFYAADENTPLGTWLDIIDKTRRAPVTVSLLPAESASLISRLAPETKEGWSLLLSAQQTGGFRQIVAKNGEIIFTRLTPPLPPMTHPDFIAETLAQDVKATRSYLLRAGLAENAPLSFVALLPRPLHEALKKQALPISSFSFLTPEEAACKLSFPPQTETSADLLHALWFQTKRKPSTSLVRPDRAAAAKETLVRRTSLALASFLFMLALGLAGARSFELFTLSAKNRETQNEIAALAQRIETSRDALLAEAAPLERLRLASARRRLYETRREGPDSILPLIDAALGPEARAKTLIWKDGALTLDLALKDDGLTGSLEELSQNEITRRFDDIAAFLRTSLPDYETTILRYPFPHLPSEPITNKGNKKAASPLVATFALRRREK